MKQRQIAEDKRQATFGAYAQETPSERSGKFGAFSAPSPTGEKRIAYPLIETRSRYEEVLREARGAEIASVGQQAKAEGYERYATSETTAFNEKWRARGNVRSDGTIELSEQEYVQYQAEKQDLERRLAPYKKESKILQASAKTQASEASRLITAANKAAPVLAYKEFKAEDQHKYAQQVAKASGKGFTGGLVKVKETSVKGIIPRYKVELSEPAKQILIPTGIGAAVGGPPGAAAGAFVGLGTVAGQTAPLIAEKYDIPGMGRSEARVVRKDSFSPGITTRTLSILGSYKPMETPTVQEFFETPDADETYRIRSRTEDISARLQIGSSLGTVVGAGAAQPVVQAAAQYLAEPVPEYTTTDAFARLTINPEGHETREIISRSQLRGRLGQKVGDPITTVQRADELVKLGEWRETAKLVTKAGEKPLTAIRTEKVFDAVTRTGSPIKYGEYVDDAMSFQAEINKNLGAQAFKTVKESSEGIQVARGVGTSIKYPSITKGINVGQIEGKGIFSLRYSIKDMSTLTGPTQPGGIGETLAGGDTSQAMRELQSFASQLTPPVAPVTKSLSSAPQISQTPAGLAGLTASKSFVPTAIPTTTTRTKTSPPVTTTKEATRTVSPAMAVITVPKTAEKLKPLSLPQEATKTRSTSAIAETITTPATATVQVTETVTIPETVSLPMPGVIPPAQTTGFPKGTPPYVPYVPPTLLFGLPDIPLGVPSFRPGEPSMGAPKSARYAPSVLAEFFGVVSEEEQPATGFTGFELRPVVRKRKKK